MSKAKAKAGKRKEKKRVEAKAESMGWALVYRHRGKVCFRHICAHYSEAVRDSIALERLPSEKIVKVRITEV